MVRKLIMRFARRSGRLEILHGRSHKKKAEIINPRQLKVNNNWLARKKSKSKSVINQSPSGPQIFDTAHHHPTEKAKQFKGNLLIRIVSSQMVRLNKVKMNTTTTPTSRPRTKTASPPS